MRTYTIQDIRDLDPRYEPSEKLPGDWTGTAVDVLNMDHVPPEDRLWVVSHWLDDRTLRLFAVWCARKYMELANDPDSRSVCACDVAERHANGKATDGELSDARAAAKGAAKGAAKASAQDAACAAARSAADVAAWAASWAVAYITLDATWAIAEAAAWAAQINHLITMIEEHARL